MVGGVWGDNRMGSRAGRGALWGSISTTGGELGSSRRRLKGSDDEPIGRSDTNSCERLASIDVRGAGYDPRVVTNGGGSDREGVGQDV